MTFIPEGWTAAEVEHELIDAPSRAYVPFEGLEVVDRPDFQQLTCSAFPSGGFNGVMRCRVAQSQLESTILRTLTHYADRGLSFRWSVLPGSTPELAAQLEARGLLGSQTVAMARSTAPVGKLARGAGIRVTEVGPAEVERFTDVMAEGWESPSAALLRVHHVALADPARRQRLFLASVDGVDAGVASVMLFERSAYLLGAVVLPRFRRRGVYGALIDARLAVAQALHIPLATSHARASTSAPQLTRHGFDAWFRFWSFSPRR